MAFVALTSASLTLRGKSGRIYQIGFTKATAVGMVTFDANSQQFYNLPEDCQIIDGYCGNAVNATDYLDVYLNNQIRSDMRINTSRAYAGTTTPRIPPSGWIRGGTMLQLYHYSA